MPKIRHSLTINTIGTEFNKFVYDFGQTKGVELIIAETGIQITAELTKSFDPIEMLCGDSYLFADGINKALLLYLIRFSKTLKIDALTLRIDNEEEIILLGQNADPPIYSMINGTLHRPIPAEFSGEVITDQLLKMTKSKYDKRIAALFALLLSKSKIYETERFIYLWTSLNGMYSWISDFVAEANGVEKYRKEYKQIIAFQQFIDVGSGTIAEKDKAPIAHRVVSILGNISNQRVSKADIESTELSQEISTALITASGEKYNLTAYGYILTQLSYYFRCKIVHGSRPVLLFAHADNKELHALKVINDLLEEFIDSNLHAWFDEKYIADTIIAKAQKIKLS